MKEKKKKSGANLKGKNLWFKNQQDVVGYKLPHGLLMRSPEATFPDEFSKQKDWVASK